MALTVQKAAAAGWSRGRNKQAKEDKNRSGVTALVRKQILSLENNSVLAKGTLLSFKEAGRRDLGE